MSDNLKDYINNNRESFDDLEPGDLWTRIETTLNQTSANSTSGSDANNHWHKSASFKKIKAMFKYGFGASALVLGTFLIVNSQKEKASTSELVSEIKTSSLIDSSHLVLPASKEPLAPQTESKQNSETKKIADRETENEIANAQTPAETVAYQDSVKEENQTTIKKEKVPYFIAHEYKKDSLPPGDGRRIDTLFDGISKIVINKTDCDINVRGTNNTQVKMHGVIEENSGRFIVLGLRAYQRSEFEIKLEKKDSVLMVWMDAKKVNKRVKIKDLRGKSSSVLDFEVPEKTNLVINNCSGNVSISNLKNKNMLLNTSFGNITASDIVADLNLSCSSGNITLTNITGIVHSSNSFGNQVVTNSTGNIKLKSSSGSIIVKKLNGNAEVNSSFGSQKFEDVVGNIITGTSSGNIDIRHLKGNVNSRSSFGKQYYEDIDGSLNSNASSGDITANDTKGMMNLTTSFGNITGKNVTLISSGEFKTSSGSIHMDFQNEIKDLSFDLKSSSGKILIDKNNFKTSANDKLYVGQGGILVKGSSSFGNQTYQ